MGRFNNVDLLGVFEHDSVTNSLQEPDVVAGPAIGTGYPITTKALYTGPKAVFITDLMVAFGDIVVTDPTADRYLGWAVYSATNFGASPTFAAVTGAAYTANADCPHIHDNSVSTTAIQAVVNAPVNLMAYVGNSGDGVYATRALEPAKKRAPIRIAAHSLYQVRVGTYNGGSLAAVTGLDDVVVFVYGYTA